MRFRPSFCSNCGEKIERADWKLWTSRRFCDLCATDFTLQEFIPTAIVGFAALISVFGIANYFSSGFNRQSLAAVKAFEKPQVQNADHKIVKPAVPLASPARPIVENTTVEQQTRPLAPPRAPAQAINPVVGTTGPIYLCGAATKKGTPCSRKVKGNVRCWQHIGQPAMLPPEKLLVSR